MDLLGYYGGPPRLPLTGRWLMDPTNASMTGLYETVSQGGWNLEIADAFDIDRGKLPEIAWCDEQIGGLTRSAASQLGMRSGTPLIMGGGDTACATYGAGGVGRRGNSQYFR